MKACIYGAGAVGGYLAARLHKGGAEVSVIARGQNLEAIRKNGISLETPDYTVSAKVNASDRPEELGVQDFVVVAVKSSSLPSIVDGIRPLLGPTTTVAFALNGLPWWYFYKNGGAFDGRQLDKLDPAARLWDAVNPVRVVGGVIVCSCELKGLGQVYSDVRKPQIFLGEPSGEISARAQQLAGLLRGDTLQVDVIPSIRDAIWSKLQSNMCFGLLGCLTDSPPMELYNDPVCVATVRRIVAEVAAIARSIGRDVSDDASEIINRGLKQRHRSSIILDLEKGRPMEIDTMFDVPLDIARMSAVDTPTLDLLVSLVKARARKAGAYRG